MNPPLQLSAPDFARAAGFMRQARPLERVLFAFHFEEGGSEPVHTALQAFQNFDGGFHGLEPDIGFAESSVLSTCHALHLLDELQAPATDRVVPQALDYLIATFDTSREVWPIIPAHDNSQPHAPWWHHSDQREEAWHGWLDNPRPDVLACLQAFPCAKTRPLISQVARATLSRLRATTGALEMHSVLCYLRLYHAPQLDPELKQELERVIPLSIAQAVERDPAKWNGYGLRPLDVAPRADSPWRPLLGPEIEANLDFLIHAQAADGSWHPHWNWGGSFPEAWPQAKLKWQAFLTLANLRTLRSYGRLARA